MPYGLYDQAGTIFPEVKRHNVAVVVVLVEDHEQAENAHHDLPSLYDEHGLKVIRLPIPNYGVPTVQPLEAAVLRTIVYVQAEHNALIHCSAGLGRTALFLVFLAMRVLKLSGREAIGWVGQHHPRALLPRSR